MNVRLYDGTVRCYDHMDASSYQGQTSDPCTYCQCGWTAKACRASQAKHGRGDDCPDHPWGAKISLVKTYAQSHGRTVSEFGLVVRRRKAKKIQPPRALYDHYWALRNNDLTALASAFWLDANARGVVGPIAGTIADGKVVPVRF